MSNIKFENISGKYFNLMIKNQTYRIYMEESGKGIPLVCLHTAGSDSRQFRHVLNDKQINKQFRGKDKATNVLSFPDKELTKVSNTCIGEILICNDVLEEESKEQNKNMFDHFVHLTVHSMLHMVGYGHDVANNAILMENKEVKFLSKIGISDPYK